MTKSMLTAKEVAQHIGTSARYVRYLCATGRIHHCERVGGAWIIQNGFVIIEGRPRGRPRKMPRV